MAYAGHASAAVVLVWLTLWLQAVGMAALIRGVQARLTDEMSHLGVFRSGIMMVRFTGAIFVLHLLQISLWAGFYRWKCFRSWEAAFYFSATSYSTVGYGDLTLPVVWRNLGPLEGVAGMLMSGLSAALLFAIVLRLVERETSFSLKS
jgi:hypothetical protein